MDLILNSAALPEIDLYCERETNHWLDEPLGLLSNSAFLAAAWYSARPSFRQHSMAVQWLIGLLAAIGIGSAAFHASATRWGLLMDVIPIQLFILSTLWILLRAQLQYHVSLSICVMVGFVGVSSLVPGHWLHGSASYLPAWCALTIITLFSPPGVTRSWLARAAALFPVSLAFRTLDLPACSLVPFGTHFLWHLCNALVLWMMIEATKALPSTGRARKSGQRFPFAQILHNNPPNMTRKDP